MKRSLLTALACVLALPGLSVAQCGPYGCPTAPRASYATPQAFQSIPAFGGYSMPSYSIPNYSAPTYSFSVPQYQLPFSYAPVVSEVITYQYRGRRAFSESFSPTYSVGYGAVGCVNCGCQFAR